MKEGKKKMDNLARKFKKYTYEDLLNMPEDKRYEIIDGELYLMSSPTTVHQQIIESIYAQLYQYLKGKKCQAFIAPLDVCLSGQRNPQKEYNVVQPDVFVICDTQKITKDMGIQSTPDSIIEVLSPSNKKTDMVLKYNLYQQYGVKNIG